VCVGGNSVWPVTRVELRVCTVHLPHTSLDIYLSVQVSRALSFILRPQQGLFCFCTAGVVTGPPRASKALVYEAVSQRVSAASLPLIDWRLGLLFPASRSLFTFKCDCVRFLFVCLNMCVSRFSDIPLLILFCRTEFHLILAIW